VLLAEAGCCEDSEETAASYTKKGNRFHLCFLRPAGSDMTRGRYTFGQPCEACSKTAGLLGGQQP